MKYKKGTWCQLLIPGTTVMSNWSFDLTKDMELFKDDVIEIRGTKYKVRAEDFVVLFLEEMI